MTRDSNFGQYLPRAAHEWAEARSRRVDPSEDEPNVYECSLRLWAKQNGLSIPASKKDAFRRAYRAQRISQRLPDVINVLREQLVATGLMRWARGANVNIEIVPEDKEENHAEWVWALAYEAMRARESADNIKSKEMRVYLLRTSRRERIAHMEYEQSCLVPRGFAAVEKARREIVNKSK